MGPRHGWGAAPRETLWTLASLITLIRTGGAVIGAGIAWSSHDIHYLIGGLIIYWVGDAIDGIIARLMQQETQLGAIFDIMSDRLSVLVIYLAFVTFAPELLWVVLAFVLQFVVIDGILSLSFLRFNLLSINYFYLVDEIIYRLNWSMTAKVMTSTVFMLTLLIWRNVWLSSAVVVIVYAIKIYSLVRLHSVVHTAATKVSTSQL